MKSFKMNQFVKTPSGEPVGAGCATDEAGYLYDPQVRAMFPSAFPQVHEMEALAALRIASKGLHLSMERFAEKHGLSEGRMGLMIRLRRHGETNLSDLAEGLAVSPRNVTGLVDGLERDGYVERIPDPADRRSVRARLTPNGSQKIEALWDQAMAQQTPVLDGFTQEDMALLRHLLLRVIENMRKARASHEKEGDV
jgi:DNA-binding MarR family transcriptional regulator